MPNNIPFDVAGPGLGLGVLALSAGAMIILFILIVLAESVALQLMSWGTFKRSLQGAFLMNLASTLLGFAVLGLVPRLGLWGVSISWGLSVAIEGLVLMRMKPGAARHDWLASLVANLASYLILILPAYLFSQ